MVRMSTPASMPNMPRRHAPTVSLISPNGKKPPTTSAVNLLGSTVTADHEDIDLYACAISIELGPVRIDARSAERILDSPPSMWNGCLAATYPDDLTSTR